MTQAQREALREDIAEFDLFEVLSVVADEAEYRVANWDDSDLGVVSARLRAMIAEKETIGALLS